VEAGNKNLDMIPTSSSTNLLALGDCLAISLASRNNFNKKKFGSLHPSGLLGKNLAEISEIMITGSKIPIVKKNSKLKDVVLKISSGQLGCVIVTDKSRKIAGFISNGDMSRAIKKYQDIFKKKASDIMSNKPKTITKNCLIIDALNIMNNEKITVLIVSKNRKILGLVHLHDILSFLNS